MLGVPKIILSECLRMRVGPPRINLAMFRQTAHASPIKLGLLMTLNLPGWHLQVRKCVWKRILFIVLQMI